MKKSFIFFALFFLYACGGGGDPVPQAELDTFIDSGPDEGSTTGPDVTFTFSSSEAGATFMCMTEGWHSCTSPFSSNGNFPGGPMIFQVKAVFDGVEDSTPAERNWTVDDTPPQTAITNGPGSFSGDVVGPAPYDATFMFESDDPNAVFECKMSPGGDWHPCASPMDYDNLPDGPYIFQVRATDAVGNQDPTPDDYSFNVMSIF